MHWTWRGEAGKSGHQLHVRPREKPAEAVLTVAACSIVGGTEQQAGGAARGPHSAEPQLHVRPPQASSSSGGGGDGASVVAIPSPETPDEALADTFKRKGNEFFVAGDYEGAAKLYELSLSHWTK